MSDGTGPKPTGAEKTMLVNPQADLHWSLEKPELASSQVSPPAPPRGMVTVGHRLIPRERKRTRMNFRACTCGAMAQGKVSDLPNPKQEGD